MRETWHEHYLRLLLPDNLRNNCSVSLSIQQFLCNVQNDLKVLYGDRADWKKNIQRHYESEEYLSRCRRVKKVDDIPEINIKDIKSWISKEEAFTSSINHLLELLPLFDDKDKSGEAYVEAAYLLGLVGANPDAIYHYIINWDDISDQEMSIISENIRSHPREMHNVISTLIKLCINGRLVTYPVVETVMTQQKQRYYYRGENAFYGSSKPGAFRWGKGKPDWLVQRINRLRSNEGCEFLDNFISTFAWSYSTTNHYALCQHYGMNTEMMDITSDIWAALFFACSKYKNGKWQPLKADEIAKVDSREDISKRGGDSRYGIIYRRLVEPVELGWANNSDFWGSIYPIGFQPYMRCSYQHAYGMFINDSCYDMYTDERFAKYKLRLNEDLCNWVFEKTHGGKDVFPIEDIPDISGYMKRINETRRFSRSSFESIVDGQRIPKSEWERVKYELFQYGYVIDQGKVSFITEEEIRQINDAYPPERAKMLTEAKPVSDPLIIMTTDEQSQKDREADDYKYRFMMVSAGDVELANRIRWQE